jgi:hypothetical protein
MGGILVNGLELDFKVFMPFGYADFLKSQNFSLPCIKYQNPFSN